MKQKPMYFKGVLFPHGERKQQQQRRRRRFKATKPQPIDGYTKAIQMQQRLMQRYEVDERRLIQFCARFIFLAGQALHRRRITWEDITPQLMQDIAEEIMGLPKGKLANVRSNFTGKTTTKNHESWWSKQA